MKVCRALCERSGDYIRWPQGRELRRVQEEFEEISGFPNVIGAIDGCHIQISAPSENPDSYFCRKNFHSLLLQGICDANLRFINIYAGICGSVHDARVWNLSDIKEAIEVDKERYFPGDSHMLGDSAYGVQSFLMVPYKDYGNMTAVQRHYNTVLSKHRVVVERGYGLLKGRCRRLKYLYLQKIKNGSLIIAACCVLHNICLDLDDEVNEEILNELDPIEEDDLDPLENERINLPAQIKRDAIAEMLFETRRR
ncbi:putative nuclease HARBI1 [Leptopilina heterotoma]|uniref:putative nuclease HARBI1 n=1 Tax=Leptopilina heterotoma TaxID=63436 RepID=UPI001CAA2108|nr:putative nuclease HARBI1 [Leptopilina heterotoma]XP_043469667.1 putative nuclease HARBI1 [Leptopilina heterotoma]